jgi:hypothetical protein
MDALIVDKNMALKIAMSAYLGEHCKFCGQEFKTLEDLKDTVFAGYHEHGRLAHQECWDENAKDD